MNEIEFRRRPYRGESDIARLQAFSAEAIAQTGGCGYVHPGDIPHRLFNGNRLFDPAEVLTIWEDDRGVAAWVHVGPRHGDFDAEVRPDLRVTGLERHVLEFAGQRVQELMRRHDYEGDRIYHMSCRSDQARVAHLTALGWTKAGEPPWAVNRAELKNLPGPVLPDGFTIRPAAGIEDAAALAEVHAASFGSTWTPEMYRKVMESPGYAAEREFVVCAPNGSFAAFTVTWHDERNRTGLFEPVGTHKDYRRLGLGKALVLFGMRGMAAAGMESAVVVNEGTNAAAQRLYASCGFRLQFLLDTYEKRISE